MVPYSTNLNCGSSSCPADQSLSPLNCYCAYPYEGLMIFRAPYFRDLTNATPFKLLETNLWTKINITPGSVYLSNPFFDTQDYLRVDVKFFPSAEKYFNRSEVLRVGLFLSNQVFKAPLMFGTYYFIAFPYPFQGPGRGSSLRKGAVAGIAIASIVIIIGLVALMFYAFRQKKRGERAIKQSKPFATWTTGDKDTSAPPELKGAKWFSFSDLRKSTNSFSESNEIVSGGYGKGYLDPEYYMVQQLTDRSDVYSFGVVMLEIISSRKPIEKGKYIVREVRLAMDANDKEYYGLKEIMDPKLRNGGTLVGFRRFVELAMQCVEEAAANRPSMNEVVKEITRTRIQPQLLPPLRISGIQNLLLTLTQISSQKMTKVVIPSNTVEDSQFHK